jgi:regulatory protein
MSECSHMQAAYNYAVSLLAKRDYSRYALARKIVAHHQLADDELASLLDNLEAQNYLSDSRCAQGYIRNCYDKGRGPRYIQHKLQQKGINAVVVDAALAKCELDWDKLAQEVAVKKFGQQTNLSAIEGAKQQRFLYARGFTN